MASKKHSSPLNRLTLADTGEQRHGTVPDTGPVAVISQIGAAGIVLGRTFRLIFSARTDKGDTLRLTHRYTNGSATFIIISMSFVGMIMVYQSTEQLARAIGDTHLVGATFLKLLVRVLGPTVTGLLLACRVGAGIAAEIGAMSVTSQLDAMRMCSANPIEVLMVPRLRGGILASIVMVIVGSGAAAVAGLVTGIVLFSMSPGIYWNFELLGFADLIQGLVKALSYGVVIPVISGACGLAASGGARGVGQATTSAVVGSSFAIITLDSIISLISHVIVGQ
jgi:phospholipid/cholesterol/gamma-HCH transport system permease protein